MKLKLNEVMKQALNQIKESLRKTDDLLKRTAHTGGKSTSTDVTA